MPDPARILVVEDEARIAEVVQSYLEAQGHVVDWAASGEEALAAAARRRPDLVVLDLGLPGMPGEDVCRRLRAESDVPTALCGQNRPQQPLSQQKHTDRAHNPAVYLMPVMWNSA